MLYVSHSQSATIRPGHETAESLSPARHARQRKSGPFWLTPVAPFRLDLTAWALRRRAGNLIDRWDGGTYRRVLVAAGKPIEAAVTQEGPVDAARLRVRLAGDRLTVSETRFARGVLERLLGLNIDLSEFYELAGKDPKLRPLAARFRGVKPPRFPTLFEALANAIACQQMSLTLGILLLSRLTERFGLPARKTQVRRMRSPGRRTWWDLTRKLSASSALAGKRDAP